MKSKQGVNWRNWKRLLEFLKTLKPKQINMGPYFAVNNEPKMAPLKMDKLHLCNTVGCIQGYGDLIFKSQNGAADFRRALGINPDEYDYIVYGKWGLSGDIQSRYQLGKRDVIKYMTKALNERNVRVSL